MTRRVLTMAGALLAQGCFLTSTPYTPPTADDAERYSARVATDSTDVEAAAALALLHLQQGREEAAEVLLARVDERLPGDPAVPLLLAIARERLGNQRAAYDGYGSYRSSHIGQLAGRAGTRMRALGASIVRQNARDLLALGPGAFPLRDDGLVAVLPFAHSGGAPDAEGLAVAVAEISAREVGDVRGWDAVDGAMVRALLDEMGVPVARRADLAVGVEVGRRVGAAHVVQGVSRRLSLEVVVWDVTVTTLGEGSVLQVYQVALESAVGQVVGMQRRLSRLVEQVAADQPTATRDGPPVTESVAAMAAFGEALLAWDRGDIAAARAAYALAVELDSDFVLAAEQAALFDELASAPSLDSLAIEAARLGELQRWVAALRTGPGSPHGDALARVGARERPLVADMLGLDALTGSVLLDLVFTIPGGSP